MTRGDFPPTGRSTLPDGVFQSPIRQHDFFEALSPRATATVRITTARELDGSIGVKAAYLRVGRSNDDIVRSANAVKIPLDRGSGTLGHFGYLPDWHRVDAHPDTGFRFSGHAVPHFAEAISLCKSLHERCPHMPSPDGACSQIWATRPSSSSISVSRASMSGLVTSSARYHWTSRPSTVPASSRLPRLGSKGESAAM